MSEVINMSVQDWRQKSREGVLLPQEMRAAIEAIRKERLGAGIVSAASKEKKVVAAKKKEPINSDDLLAGLM